MASGAVPSAEGLDVLLLAASAKSALGDLSEPGSSQQREAFWSMKMAFSEQDRT